MLLLCLVVFCQGIFAAKKNKDFEISWGRFNIHKATPAALKELKSTPKDKQASTVVLVCNECTDDDLKKICTVPWIRTLEIQYGNENISDISPLANLKELKSLSLKSLKKSKEKPIDLKPLKDLENLEKIDFYATRVKNTDGLAKCTKLKDISFYMSAVDSIDFLKNTPDVEKLDLYGFKHTFKDYKPVAGLKKLKELNVYMNEQATDENLAVLSALTALEKYSTSNNKDFTSFDFLKNCKNMKRIDAAWCSKLKDISALAGMENLKNLDVRDSIIDSIDVLKGKKKLDQLNISGTKVTDLSPIKDCTLMRMLYFGKTGIKNLSPLKNMKNLSFVEFNDTPVSDLTPLSECNDLYNMDFQNTKVKDLSPLLNIKRLGKIAVSKDIPQNEIDKIKKKFPKCRVKVSKN